MKIAFPLEEALEGVAFILPNLTCGLTLEEIARKDVPQGTPYKFVDGSIERSSVSFETPDGYGDPEGYWAEHEGT